MLITIFMFILSYTALNYYKSKRHLHMLQQNLYNENHRYIKWIWKNKETFIGRELIATVISLVGIFVIYDLEQLSIIGLLGITILFLSVAWKWKKTIDNNQNKKKLVITARIKRLIFSLGIILFIPLIFLGIYMDNLYKTWIVILILCIMSYFNAFVVFMAMIINMPVEKIVYNYYKNKAMKKLKEMPFLKVIGITGSYGKTSSKNILNEILNIKYNALPTPRNLNTYNGLIMTINNDMDKFTDIFIAEMGAYVKGEIAGLCKLVKPKYGILTTIGTAHLESFGSEDNIIQGKFELIESLPNDGFAILNGDDPKQVNYKLKSKVKIIWIGIENKEVDVRAENIKCSSKGTSFDVVIKGKKEKYHFETRLLGEHNVYNILDGIACGIEFDITMDDLIQAVKMIRPIEHRLELKRLGNFYMIDDAYNSNPVGAKRALEVLKKMPGTKVVVTPGMIELGDKEYEYNKKFGEQISEVADTVILIGEKKTQPIKEGLLTKGFDKEQIIVFNDVREAYPYLTNEANNQEIYALFENDLPDTYNEN